MHIFEKSRANARRVIEDYAPAFYILQHWHYSTIAPIWKEREKYNLTGSGLQWSHNTYGSDKAIDTAEHMIVNIKNSIFLTAPFIDVFRLNHNGVDFSLIKEFVKTYNRGIINKLSDKNRIETDPAIIGRLKNILPGNCLAVT